MCFPVILLLFLSDKLLGMLWCNLLGHWVYKFKGRCSIPDDLYRTIKQADSYDSSTNKDLSIK